MKNSNSTSSIDNIYQLDGKVPLGKAIPFGLQHVLAMFVANIVPIVIVAGAGNLSQDLTTALLQNCMFIAGIGTLIQLFPIWRIGSGLPVVMGVSFTFVAILSYVAANFGYPVVVGAIIIGGLIEGTLGLLAKYWKRFISPVVSACVVLSIGFSLLPVGARSFGGGYVADFGSAQNMLLGGITLLSLLLFTIFAKGYLKQLAILFGLIVGYIVALFMGKVDFSAFHNIALFDLPKFLPVKPEFNISAIISVTLVFLVSATETIGDTTACAVMGIGREPSEKEISGSLACDGYSSSISGLFSCLPVTSFSQNVGLIAMTKVVNRYTIATGGIALILAGLFPPIGAFFNTLPEAVLGGCTILMFGQIVISGIRMLAKSGFSQRNTLIAAFSLAIGLGFPSEAALFNIFPTLVAEELSNNCVAIVFIISLILDLTLPKNMEVTKETEN
ncbi:MAG: uracil-xanthine permease family protein [Pleomorphochaeta sp.]|jgi:NCS2 family nucleobase:cation symporter-2